MTQGIPRVGRGQPRPLTRGPAYSLVSILAIPVWGCNESLSPRQGSSVLPVDDCKSLVTVCLGRVGGQLLAVSCLILTFRMW